MVIIKEALVDPLNQQIRNEFANMFGYLALSVYFEHETLPELAAFFSRQAEDERSHAMKFINFLLAVGLNPVIPGVPEVNNSFASAEAAVQAALNQELKTTDQINRLVSLATAEGDHTTNQFLQWFVTEQVEEVNTMTTLLQTIKHAGGNLLWVEDFVRRHMPPVGAASEVTAGASG